MNEENNKSKQVRKQQKLAIKISYLLPTDNILSQTNLILQYSQRLEIKSDLLQFSNNLGQFKFLKELNLNIEHNKIDNDKSLILLESLNQLTLLNKIELHLANNDIDDQAMKILGEYAKTQSKNQQLKEFKIDITKNYQISNVGIQQFFEQIKESQIQNLGIKIQNISQILSQIFENLSKSTQILSFTIEIEQDVLNEQSVKQLCIGLSQMKQLKYIRIKCILENTIKFNKTNNVLNELQQMDQEEQTTQNECKQISKLDELEKIDMDFNIQPHLIQPDQFCLGQFMREQSKIKTINLVINNILDRNIISLFFQQIQHLKQLTSLSFTFFSLKMKKQHDNIFKRKLFKLVSLKLTPKTVFIPF